MSENETNQEIEVEYLWKRMKSKSIKTMRHEVAEWLTGVTGKSVSSANVLKELKTGEVLLHCAKSLLILNNQDGSSSKEVNENDLEELNPDSVGELDDPQTAARCRTNISKFLSWCRKIGIEEIVLFESDDLVLEKNERQVLNCILRITDLFAKYGSEPPQSVEKERKHKAAKKLYGTKGSELGPTQKPIMNSACDVESNVEKDQASFDIETTLDQDQEKQFPNLNKDQTRADDDTISTDHNLLLMNPNQTEPIAIVDEVNSSQDNFLEKTPSSPEEITLTTPEQGKNRKKILAIDKTLYDEVPYSNNLESINTPSGMGYNAESNSQSEKSLQVSPKQSDSSPIDSLKPTENMGFSVDLNDSFKEENSQLIAKDLNESLSNDVNKEKNIIFINQINECLQNSSDQTTTNKDDDLRKTESIILKDHSNQMENGSQSTTENINRDVTEDLSKTATINSTDQIENFFISKHTTSHEMQFDGSKGTENMGFTGDLSDPLEDSSQVENAHTTLATNAFEDGSKSEDLNNFCTTNNNPIGMNSDHLTTKRVEKTSTSSERFTSENGDLYTLLNHSFKIEKHSNDLEENVASEESTNRDKRNFDLKTGRVANEKLQNNDETSTVTQTEKKKNQDNQSVILDPTHLDYNNAESKDGNVLASPKRHYSDQSTPSRFNCYKPEVIVSAIIAVLVLIAVITIAAVLS